MGVVDGYLWDWICAELLISKPAKEDTLHVSIFSPFNFFGVSFRVIFFLKDFVPNMG